MMSLPDLSHLQAQNQLEVMMVCLGNICRSPMAAAVLATRAREIKSKDIAVTSSGTSAWHVGQGPNPPSQRVWERAGYAYTHVASQTSPDRIKRADLVLVMDSDNLAKVLAMSDPIQHAKVFYLRDFDVSDDEREIPDPYGREDQAFESVLTMVERSIDGLLIALGVAEPSGT